MKKLLTLPGFVCDSCGKEATYMWRCDRCGKDFCWECKGKLTVDYPNGLHFDGQEGRYCKECDAALAASKDEPLYNAYRAIRALREEYNAFSESLSVRAKAAEQEVARLLDMEKSE